MDNTIWVAIITSLSTLIGTLGGVWLTSRYESKRRKQEIFLIPKKELYVRLLSDIKIQCALDKGKNTILEEAHARLKSIVRDLEDIRLITKNQDLVEDLEEAVSMITSGKFDPKSNLWKKIQSAIRKELGIEQNKNNFNLWKYLQKKVYMKKAEPIQKDTQL